MKARDLFVAVIVATIAAGMACLALGNALTSVRETVTQRVVLDPNARLVWSVPGATILTDPVTGDRYYERTRITAPFNDESLLLGGVGFALLSAVGIAAGVAAGRHLFIRAVRREVARQLTQLSGTA